MHTSMDDVYRLTSGRQFEGFHGGLLGGEFSEVHAIGEDSLLIQFAFTDQDPSPVSQGWTVGHVAELIEHFIHNMLDFDTTVTLFGLRQNMPMRLKSTTPWSYVAQTYDGVEFRISQRARTPEPPPGRDQQHAEGDVWDLQEITPAERSRFEDAVRILNELESTAPHGFVGLRFFRDRHLPAPLGDIDRPEIRGAMIRRGQHLGIFVIGEIPNPKRPGFSTATVALNRDNDIVRSVLGAAAEHTQAYPEPAAIQGAPLSQSLIEERSDRV